MDEPKTIVVTFAIFAVFCDLGAGTGNIIIEEANGHYADELTMAKNRN
jgi:hypothetical protein